MDKNLQPNSKNIKNEEANENSEGIQIQKDANCHIETTNKSDTASCSLNPRKQVLSSIDLNVEQNILQAPNQCQNGKSQPFVNTVNTKIINKSLHF